MFYTDVKTLTLFLKILPCYVQQEKTTILEREKERVLTVFFFLRREFLHLIIRLRVIYVHASIKYNFVLPMGQEYKTQVEKALVASTWKCRKEKEKIVIMSASRTPVRISWSSSAHVSSCCCDLHGFEAHVQPRR